MPKKESKDAKSENDSKVESGSDKKRGWDDIEKLFDDKKAYDRFQHDHAPSLGSTSGFYHPKKNIAAIHTGNYGPQTFAITRHESVHAMIAGLFGPIPIWANEGLAEVFESLSVRGQNRVLQLNPHHLQTLQTQLEENTLPSLENLWSYDFKNTWYDQDKGTRYAMSWALMFYLLSEPPRRVLLTQMMQTWQEAPCKPFSSKDYVDQNWPQGLANLEAGWHQWITKGRMSPIYF